MVENFLFTNSRPAANRTFWNIPVRYLNSPLTKLFLKYNKENSNYTISISTFRRYTPEWYKKPLKETDKCNICEKGKKIERWKQSGKKMTNKKNIFLEYFGIHKEINESQKKYLNSLKENLQYNECICIADFKENIKINIGPVELSSDFYERSQRTLFNVTVYFNDNGKLKHKFINFVSEILSHDTLFVKDCFSKLLTLEFFKFKKIFLWN